jgi:hypothetical protein
VPKFVKIISVILNISKKLPLSKFPKNHILPNLSTKKNSANTKIQKKHVTKIFKKIKITSFCNKRSLYDSSKNLTNQIPSEQHFQKLQKIPSDQNFQKTPQTTYSTPHKS